MAADEAGDKAGRVWDMIEDIDFCMFVTHSGEGLHGRPMSSLPRREENTIYFLSDRRAVKDDELAADPYVHLGYARGHSFLSVSGVGRVLKDRALVERLWTPSAKAFWPNGPHDENIQVIAVLPDIAEYWDGPNGAIAGIKMAFAIATGHKPDLGDNAKVSL